MPPINKKQGGFGGSACPHLSVRRRIYEGERCGVGDWVEAGAVAEVCGAANP